MMIIARIVGLSLFAAGLGAALGVALFWHCSNGGFLMILLGCVGGIIGAVAGAAREIVTALRQRQPGDGHAGLSS